jgi:hypothetical protein
LAQAHPLCSFARGWGWNLPANEAGHRRPRRRRSGDEVESAELSAALQVRLQIQEHAGDSPPADLPFHGGGHD